MLTTTEARRRPPPLSLIDVRSPRLLRLRHSWRDLSPRIESLFALLGGMLFMAGMIYLICWLAFAIDAPR